MISSIDVAKLAGVYQSTVSRVMNNPQRVDPVKRARVEQAMLSLGYHPNLIARNLGSKTTQTIALISGTLQNDFFVESADSIVNYANNQGYKTLVYFENEGKLQELVDTVLGYKVDGILLSSIMLDDPVFAAIEKSGVPYVLFNRRPRNGGSYVVMDNELAAAMLTQHLLDMGHRSIAYISGHTNISTFYERKIGFEKAMKAADVPIRPDRMYFVDTAKAEIQKLTWTIMQDTQPPTAILCATDEMALSCMDALMQMGRSIPQDVSLAGFDDISISSHQAIQLTSVGQHKFKLGIMAAEHLLNKINKDIDPSLPYQLVLKPELFVRKTTGQVNPI